MEKAAFRLAVYRGGRLLNGWMAGMGGGNSRPGGGNRLPGGGNVSPVTGETAGPGTGGR